MQIITHLYQIVPDGRKRRRRLHGPPIQSPACPKSPAALEITSEEGDKLRRSQAPEHWEWMELGFLVFFAGGYPL